MLLKVKCRHLKNNMRKTTQHNEKIQTQHNTENTVLCYETLESGGVHGAPTSSLGGVLRTAGFVAAKFYCLHALDESNRRAFGLGRRSESDHNSGTAIRDERRRRES